MTLRDDAIAAYQASQSGREGDARTVLANTLTPEDVSGLTVTDTQVTDSYALFVFTDSDVHLSVTLRDSGNTVALVSGQPGDWTNLAAIDSLETLGKVLPGLVPPPPPASGPDPWAPGVAYQVGDQVTYNGTTYTCRQAHSSQTGWEPPNVPALWSVAA